ncbi:uncharacterized protein Dana_GF16357, isoform B [Drosophila ananassae]|nr:E3 ubiquitin-protein ligase RNF4 isoform X2 [Drosophila ananassae]KPU80446.1 uncharacterized protein Dana_GF16357, isoform B [Drosophila ananassae]
MSSNSTSSFSNSSVDSNAGSNANISFNITAENSSLNLRMDSAAEGSHSRNASSSLSVDVAQMEAEIERINRFCEDVIAQVEIVPSTSTPTAERSSRRISTSPVEVIDLSNLEFAPPPRSARNRVPDAVIDLCTPDGPRTRPASGPATNSRRSLNQDISCVEVVDDENVSPPKRRQVNQSQQDDTYNCPVCLESVRRREPVSTKCGHVFCRACIEGAIRSTHKCPMCNKKITARQFFRLYL